jgi:hypothetical protein
VALKSDGVSSAAFTGSAIGGAQVPRAHGDLGLGRNGKGTQLVPFNGKERTKKTNCAQLRPLFSSLLGHFAPQSLGQKKWGL